jgi:HD domain
MLNHLFIATNICEDLILPETALEEQLLQTPEFNKGLSWGKPRYGHPEGAVIYHIVEVLENIERLMLNPIERETLRLVALVHDTFKFKEEQLRIWDEDYSQHHGILARRFMEQYTDDESVLKLIELHDEAYYIWKIQDETRRQSLIERLFNRLGDDLQLFYAFFMCDTKTGDKTQAPISWFESSAKGMIDFIKL